METDTLNTISMVGVFLVGGFQVVMYYWHKKTAPWMLFAGGLFLGLSFKEVAGLLLKAVGW